MRFTGQVRVPEIDHPGVPAAILIDDDQAEVFLEGESLGRWSLFDVQASRLVSSAFSLSLHGEEITFIADEPVDFAYKGVDHMAEVWARYKSMALPRRLVAVGRSRRGTLPSRIGELREAMLKNLEVAGRGVPGLAPIETAGRVMPRPEHKSMPVKAGRVSPAPVEAEPDEVTTPAYPFRPSRVEEAVPEADVAETTAHQSPLQLRPGAGLLARRVSRSVDPVATPEPVAASPEVAEPRVRSSWDEPVLDEESVSSEPVSEELEPDLPIPIVIERAEPEPDLEIPVVIERAEPELADAPDREIPVVIERAEAETADGRHLAETTEELSSAAASAVPDLVEELLGTSSDEGGEEGARDLVVDLGQYEGRRRGDTVPSAEPSPPPTPTEPALAVASVNTPERGGLLGAVRSAFARSKVAHEHVFVEAPGGIGIVRQICSECGYISIGLSD